jgi:hypothetical protein
MPLKYIKGNIKILLNAEDSLAVLKMDPSKNPIPFPAKPTKIIDNTTSIHQY